MATVWIPSLLRPLTGGQRQVTVEGSTVGEIITALERTYPGVRERLCDGDQLRAGIAVAVDGTTGTLGLLEPVAPDSEVQILPAIGGGGVVLPIEYAEGETLLLRTDALQASLHFLDVVGDEAS